mmetsp:Transcript_2467/g.5707  ORF Transcript_2467/g.5707 Transcript_2467/m.5707 type:complete len:119 (-) Transcript_2467:225-581(-)
MADSDKGYFEQYGVQPADIAKASGFFLVIGVCHTSLLFITCYFLRPTRFIVSHIPIQRVQKAFSSVKDKLDGGGGRPAVALAEAAAIKSLMAPVTLPLKIWAAVKLMQMHNAYMAGEE